MVSVNVTQHWLIMLHMDVCKIVSLVMCLFLAYRDVFFVVFTYLTVILVTMLVLAWCVIKIVFC